MTEVRGDVFPPLPAALPPVVARSGIDLNVVDVHDDDAVLWLHALIWPEHRERAARLQQALRIARAHPPQLLAGDVFDLLPGVMERARQDAALCVYDTFVVNQFSAAERRRFAALLAEHSRRRDVFRISIAWLGSEHPQLELTTFHRGAGEITLLAYCDGHARWLEWLEARIA